MQTVVKTQCLSSFYRMDKQIFHQIFNRGAVKGMEKFSKSQSYFLVSSPPQQHCWPQVQTKSQTLPFSVNIITPTPFEGSLIPVKELPISKPVPDFSKTTLTTRAPINKNDTITSDEETEISNLPVFLAIIEILEYLLFVDIEKRFNKWRSRLENGLIIKIRSHGTDVGDQAWFQIKITIPGMACGDIDIREFLKEYSDCLCLILTEMERKFEGNHMWLEKYDKVKNICKCTQWNVNKRGNSISETTKEVNKIVEGTTVVLRAFQEKHHMTSEVQHLYDYLHKLKLLYPDKSILLYMNIGEAKSQSNFGPDLPKVSLGCRILASHIQHYLGSSGESVDDTAKIAPKCGSCVTLQMVPPGGQIKMSAAVAIIPTPQEGTLFLNQACNSIQVMCFGPLCVPLLPLPEVHAGTQLKAITRLYEYGLKLSDKITSMHSKDTVRGDWHHRLRPLEEELGHDEDSTVKENIAECRLQVFLFMDGIKKNSEASVLEKLMLLETLRNNFDEIMRKNRVKVRKLMGTAINRVLKNLTVQEQKQNLLSSAIPTISDSIMCIVKKSTSECFRQSVFSSLKVTNSRQLNHVTQNKLWQIAKQRFDIKKPAVKRLFTRESEGHQNQNQNEQIHQPGGPMLPLPPEDISNQSLPGSFALADTSNQSWLDSFALADTRNQNLPGSFALADTSNQSLHGSFTLAGTNNQSLPGSFALADNSNQSWLDSFALADTNNQSLPGPFTLADNSNQSLPGSFESSSQFDDTNFDLLGSFGVENVDEMLLDQAQLPVEIDGTQPDQTRIRMTWDKADGGQSCGGSRAHTLADATLHSQPPVKRAKVQLGGHPPTMQSSRTGSPQITDEDWYNERLWDM